MTAASPEASTHAQTSASAAPGANPGMAPGDSSPASPLPLAQIRRAVFIAVAFSALCMTVILPILAPLVRELGLTESQGGWMVSCGSVAMALAARWWGARSDRIGRKPVILAGFAGLFLAYMLYTLVLWLGLRGALLGMPLFLALLLGRAVVGVFLPAVPSSAQAYMADISTPAQRSSVMALISAANGVGMIVGPAIAGTLALAGLIWPMLMATALPLVAFLIVRRHLPANTPRPAMGRPRLSPFTPGLRNWLLVALTTMLSIITLQIVAGFYFQDRLGLSATQTASRLALALAIVGAVLVLTQTAQIRWLKWQSRRLALTGAPLVMAGLATLLLTQNLPAYLLAYALLGVGSGLLFPAFMSGASLCVDRERQGAVAGLTAATQGLAAMVAPIGSTLLYEQNPAWPFCVLIVLVGIGGISALLAPRPAALPG